MQLWLYHTPGQIPQLATKHVQPGRSCKKRHIAPGHLVALPRIPGQHPPGKLYDMKTSTYVPTMKYVRHNATLALPHQHTTTTSSAGHLAPPLSRRRRPLPPPPPPPPLVLQRCKETKLARDADSSPPLTLVLSLPAVVAVSGEPEKKPAATTTTVVTTTTTSTTLSSAGAALPRAITAGTTSVAATEEEEKKKKKEEQLLFLSITTCNFKTA